MVCESWNDHVGVTEQAVGNCTGAVHSISHANVAVGRRTDGNFFAILVLCASHASNNSHARPVEALVASRAGGRARGEVCVGVDSLRVRVAANGVVIGDVSGKAVLALGQTRSASCVIRYASVIVWVRVAWIVVTIFILSAVWTTNSIVVSSVKANACGCRNRQSARSTKIFKNSLRSRRARC